MAEKPVHEQVQDLLDSWNPRPDDSGVDRLIGNQADGVPGADALPDVPLDEDGDPDYREMSNDDLQAHLAARGLSKSGTKEEMADRLEEDDADED